jgi:hypothetical protein
VGGGCSSVSGMRLKMSSKLVSRMSLMFIQVLAENEIGSRPRMRREDLPSENWDSPSHEGHITN